MKDDTVKRSKRASLKRHGTLNPHPKSVADPLFQGGEFFDSEDLVQVKYEMIRRVKVDKQPVSQSASAFGFSRPTYYQAEADFQHSGLAGLLPQKRGPRRGHKLTPEVLAFLTQLRSSEPLIRPAALAAEIKRQFNVIAHPRSIERALARQEKKLH
jgi:transposase